MRPLKQSVPGDDLEWSLLLSDAIHPNMAGHKLFAETLAQSDF